MENTGSNFLPSVHITIPDPALIDPEDSQALTQKKLQINFLGKIAGILRTLQRHEDVQEETLIDLSKLIQKCISSHEFREALKMDIVFLENRINKLNKTEESSLYNLKDKFIVYLRESRQ